MNKKEIRKLIEREKKEIADFQKFAERHNIPKDQIQEQINLYLDTLNKLLELLRTTND